MSAELNREVRDRAYMRSSRAEEKAGDLMVHFMKTVWETTGMTWTSDNDAEARQITELTIEAAVARVEAS